MSGVFLTEKDTFDVIAYFVEKDGKLELLDKKTDDCESLTITFKKPNFLETQNLIQESQQERGNSIDFLKLRLNMMYHLAKGWDANDGNEKIPFSVDKLNTLNPSIASYFIEKVQERLVQEKMLTL